MSVDLTPRKEAIREKKEVSIEPILFNLSEIKQHFDESLVSIKKQFSIADELISSGKKEEGENIFRSQYVFAEGILDFFIHEISKFAIIEMFLGLWQKTEQYNNFMIPMSSVEEGIKNPESTDWLLSRINKRFGLEVYLSGDALGKQLALIGMNYDDICKKAFPKIRGQQYISGQDRLKMIYNRRNQIAHQSDRKHETAEREEISRSEVESAIQTIVDFVEALYSEAQAHVFK